MSRPVTGNGSELPPDARFESGAERIFLYTFQSECRPSHTQFGTVAQSAKSVIKTLSDWPARLSKRVAEFPKSSLSCPFQIENASPRHGPSYVRSFRTISRWHSVQVKVRGNVTMIAECLAASEATTADPPCASATCRTNARPRPLFPLFCRFASR